ncbi:Methyl-accepting chemotaxis protein [Dissulfuribacter thermophilus]|uniref:Methyl-accepting chemotaxis protein n=1 Tax=Dissulfuribacter thermophilus TaxID=1156395 RepID=A0A1B9F8C7_9BACT|nr:methyl-accepting chemotaxis protein [Dissulfuribacter thermophilus]OCC16187.1 Methyl-accepting chemotaxis protein [Dissulfuribacter thermophilus]
MKLWQKIAVGFSVIIMVNILNFIILMYQEQKQEVLQHRVDDAVEKQLTLKQIVADHIRWKVNVLVAILNEKMPRVEVNPSLCRLGKFLNRVSATDPEEKRILNSLSSIHENMHQGAYKMQALFRPGAEVDDVFDAMTDIYNRDINKTSKKVFELLDRLEKIYDKRAEDAILAASKWASITRTLSITLNFLMLFTAVVFGLWIARSITKPVLTLKEGINHLAQGDFSKDIEIKGRDEIGEVAHAINGMLRNLRPLLKKISDGAKVIEKEAATVEAYSENAAHGGELAADRAGKMLMVSEGIVQSIIEEGQSINEISSAIQEISQSTTRANEIVNNAVEKAQVAGDTINRLGRVSEDIQGIIKLIGDIAEQTNLLALNATIEAARAGEAGKGFAVVANEVKELARQTADSTEEITNKIRAIQTESQAAIDITGEIIEIVGQINELISAIAAAVEEQTAVITDIASKVDEQNQGAQNLVEEAKVAAEAARSAVEGARQNLENIKKLLQLAREFEEDVRKFRV